MENKTINILIGLIILIVVVNLILFVKVFPGDVTSKAVAVLEDKKPIKIGFVGILSGDYSIWGQSGLAGVQLAINEFNSKGGINGRKIKLIIEDDKATPANAVNAFNKLINIDKVDAILSVSGSGATASAVPIAQTNGIPVVIGAASAPHITLTGDYIFRTMPSDTAQGKYAAEYIYNELGKKKIALVYVKNDWGQGIKEVFEPRFNELGGKIVYESGILQEDEDLKTELVKIKQTDAELLYFPVYPNNALAAFKQMKEMDFNIPVIAGDAIDGDEVIQSEYAEGILYTVGKINSPDDFKARINSLQGFENLKPNIAAATSYDAAMVLFKAIEKAGTNKIKIKQELARISHKGISNPIIEFDENGDLNNPVAETKIIRNKEAVPYN